MKTVVLATFGSLGDLHPFIALALRLRERSFVPLIATHPQHRAAVEAEGLAFHPIGPSREQVLADLNLSAEAFGRAISRDPMRILEWAIFPYLQEIHDDLLVRIREASLIVAGSLLYPARFAAERCGVSCLSVALQPMVFISDRDPPVLPQAPWLHPILTTLGVPATRLVHGAARRLLRHRAKPLAAFRRSIGLPDFQGDLLFDGQFSAQGTLATYSPLLGGVQADYPPRTSITGYTFYDGVQDRERSLPQELREFLSRGPPPLVFTLGSLAVEFPGEFYQVSCRIARQLGRRAVLVMGTAAERAGRELAAGDDLCVVGYAGFSQIFPMAEAVIHHGGIGTTGQALRAGKPQLIVPVLGDQFDNAARVVRLGVGCSLPLRRYTFPRALTRLRRILDEPLHGQQAQAVSRIVSAEDGSRVAVSVIEELLIDLDSR